MRIVLFALAIASFQQDDAARLVEQLGSARFGEREAATEGLRKLGPSALPVLRQAAQSDDIEQRTRAAALVTELEARAMVEPTQVRLAFQNQPLTEVVRELGAQAHVQLSLFPENAPGWASARVTLESSEPVPFWEAIDRLCVEAHLMVSNVNLGLVPNGNSPNPRVGRIPGLQLLQSPGAPGPMSVSGPFRGLVTNISVHRDRVFNHNGLPIAPPGVILNGVAGRLNRQMGQPQPGQEPAAGEEPGVSTQTFALGLLVQAEPRLSMVQNGNTRILEAVDDLGQSLVPRLEAAATGLNRFQPNLGFGGMPGGATLQLPLLLELPESPGRQIKRLRVAVPVTVKSRRTQPFVIPLADAHDKTFETPGLMVRIHDITSDPNQLFFLLGLTVKARATDAPDVPNQGQFGQEFAMFQPSSAQGQSQIEIADAQGRIYTSWSPYNQEFGNEGLKLALRLSHPEGLGPPAELRIYDLGRAETEAIIEFHDIPMP